MQYNDTEIRGQRFDSRWRPNNEDSEKGSSSAVTGAKRISHSVKTWETIQPNTTRERTRAMHGILDAHGLMRLKGEVQ